MWWTRRPQVSMILTIYAVGLILFILFHQESVLCGIVHIDFLPFHNVHPMSLIGPCLFMVWFWLVVSRDSALVPLWWLCLQNQCSMFMICPCSWCILWTWADSFSHCVSAYDVSLLIILQHKLYIHAYFVPTSICNYDLKLNTSQRLCIGGFSPKITL